MLRETLRRVAIAQQFESREMVAIERLHRANRQPDAMYRQCIALAQRAELRVGRPAGTHIVLRMHLEESDRLRCGEDVAKMRGLEADAGARGKIRIDGHMYVLALRPVGGLRGASGTARVSFCRSGLDWLER